MAKFVLGLVVGLVVGVLAMAYNPDLLEDTQTALERVTGLVLRGTEEAAEKIGEAADEVAEEAREAAGEGVVRELPQSPEAVEPEAESADGEPARTE